MKSFNTYEDFANDFKRCRNKEKGRPINNVYRLFQDGDAYTVKMEAWGSGPEVLFRVTPGNVMTFTMPTEHMLRHKQSLAMSMWRFFPIGVARFKTNVYRFGSVRGGWRHLHKSAPQYFEGIQFRLPSGECINARPDASLEIIPEMRKQWLRDTKRFKRGVRARIKVGALDAYVQQVVEERAKDRWATRPVDLDVLVECIKTDTYPAELLLALVWETRPTWRVLAITTEQVYAAFDGVFTRNSEDLRRRYGVFNE